jgi:hypothetical protein
MATENAHYGYQEATRLDLILKSLFIALGHKLFT